MTASEFQGIPGNLPVDRLPPAKVRASWMACSNASPTTGESRGDALKVLGAMLYPIVLSTCFGT
jgi:hypothetical protein